MAERRRGASRSADAALVVAQRRTGRAAPKPAHITAKGVKNAKVARFHILCVLCVLWSSEKECPMQMRPEAVAAYAAIAALHGRGFGERRTEALIVALLRQRQDFDPDLSLVAELDGQVVGHALFTPHT